MTESVWNKVVVESTQAGAAPDEENSDWFVMEYDSQSVLNAELERLQGMIEYTVLTDEPE